MKKKGLIISTIVMVVVLIASLTTATYAWFTSTAKTTISGFDVSVTANNDVNIGVKADNTYSSTAIANLFKTGTITLNSATPGELGSGTWGGTTGLGPNINHSFTWGAQSKAIGFASTAQSPVSGVLAKANLTPIANNSAYVYAANGDDVSSNLENVTAAVAESDYVYLFLGVQPTKALEICDLFILVDGTNSTGDSCGILAAIHVAYRVNGAASWTDVDVFGDQYEKDATASYTSGHYVIESGSYVTAEGKSSGDTYTKVNTGVSYSDNLTSATLSWNANEQAAYNTAYKTGEDDVLPPTTKAGRVRIDMPLKAINNINQVELLIYIDGNDSDCNNLGLTASGAIKIFFHTEQPAQQNNG